MQMTTECMRVRNASVVQSGHTFLRTWKAIEICCRFDWRRDLRKVLKTRNGGHAKAFKVEGRTYVTPPFSFSVYLLELAAQDEDGAVGYVSADLQLEEKRSDEVSLQQETYRSGDFRVCWYVEVSVADSERANIASHVIDQ